jgi:acetylornithine deacetylase/succinyl-diaminopimelate desuccinylase-like protein/surfactin synthase thioesterase subunit
MAGSGWLRHLTAGRTGGTLLVCFPPSEGSSSFGQWEELAPEAVIAVVETPGLAERTTVVRVVAAEVAAEVERRSGGRLVLLGVGRGGVLAYETCRALRRDGVAVDRLCVVSATGPRGSSPVDVPVTALAGSEDTPVAVGMSGWQELTTSEFHYRSLPGEHPVHETHAAEVLREALAQRPGISRRTALRLGATASGVAVLGVQGGVHGGVRAAASVTSVTSVADPTDPVELARLMIRFDTSHLGEGGNTLPYATAMRDIWQAQGVRTEIIPTPKPNNVHFIARVAGAGSAPPLLLLGHSDVVTVGTERWSVDPFGGEVRDGFVYGRGALDMKGANAAFMAAVLRHVRAGARFDRDIIYLADCDEEGSLYGTGWLVDNHWDKVAAGVVLTEGGWLINQSDGSPMLATLVCSDKRSALVELAAEARATHSTKPYPGEAIVRLAKAIELMHGFHTRVRPNALASEYFAALAASTNDRRFAAAIRQMLDAPHQHLRDLAGAKVVEYSDYPYLHNALMRTTVSFVLAGAGYYSTIIPGRATAQARVGFLPGGDDPTSTIAALRRLVSEVDVTLRVVGATPEQSEQEALDTLIRNLAIPRSSVDTDVFRHWQDAVAEVYPNTTASAAQFEAATSGNPWRARGIPVYGSYPYAIDNETLNRMHGTDERVGVEELRQGTELLYRMLGRMTIR